MENADGVVLCGQQNKKIKQRRKIMRGYKIKSLLKWIFIVNLNVFRKNPF